MHYRIAPWPTGTFPVMKTYAAFMSPVSTNLSGFELQFFIDRLMAILDRLASHARNTTNIKRHPIDNLTTYRSSRTVATLLTSTDFIARDSRYPRSLPGIFIVLASAPLRQRKQPLTYKIRSRRFTTRHNAGYACACTSTRTRT